MQNHPSDEKPIFEIRDLALNALSETEIRQKIDLHLYENAHLSSSWSSNLYHAIESKRFVLLWEMLVGAREWNIKSKEIVCDLLNEPRVYTAREIKAVIGKHCGVSIESMELYFSYMKAKRTLEIKEETLSDKFSNSHEAIQYVHKLYQDGYKWIITENRKSYMVNINKSGFYLRQGAVVDYAKAYVAYKENESLYKQDPSLQSIH